MNRHSMPFMRKGGCPRCRSPPGAPGFPCGRRLRPFVALLAATSGSSLLPLVAPCAPSFSFVARSCGGCLCPPLLPFSCGPSLAATSGTSEVPLVAVCVTSRLALSFTAALCAASAGPPATPTATGLGTALTCGSEAAAGGFTRFFALPALPYRPRWRTWPPCAR